MEKLGIVDSGEFGVRDRAIRVGVYLIAVVIQGDKRFFQIVVEVNANHDLRNME